MHITHEEVCDALFLALPTYSKIIGRQDILRLIDDTEKGRVFSQARMPGYGIDDVVILNTVIAMINLGAAFVNFLAARAKASGGKQSPSDLFAHDPSISPSFRELAKTQEGRKLLRSLAKQD